MKPQKNFNSIEYWVIIQLKLVLYTRIEKKTKAKKINIRIALDSLILCGRLLHKNFGQIICKKK